MKTLPVASTLILSLSCFVAAAPTATKSDDPCQSKHLNAEMRECYASEQARVNAESDALATEIAAEFLEEAQDSSDDTVDNELMRKAAAEVLESQKTWKQYRDQHCNAVELSWTSGSGARTAYETCLFDLGRQRVHALRSDFAVFLPHRTNHSSHKK